MTNDIELLAKAWRVAAERHVHQRRKGESQEPYVNHLAEVADLVAHATSGRDAQLVAAAVLHDTIEDTDLSREELASQFGEDVAGLVLEVTDDKALPKQNRKRLQVEHAPHISARAKVLKLADKTSNIRALENSPPRDWPLARKREYLAWARSVVDGLRGANPWLEGQFSEAAARLEALLAGESARRSS